MLKRLPIDPIKALFWSAVINGLVAVPIMVAMMLVASKRRQPGKSSSHRYFSRSAGQRRS